MQIDVTRVASQVVVGIGFLGAGVIFRERTSVRNLTTAASLWVTAAIGLMAGVGDLGTAAAAAVLLLLVLVALRPLRTLLRHRAQKPTRDLTMRLVRRCRRRPVPATPPAALDGSRCRACGSARTTARRR